MSLPGVRTANNTLSHRYFSIPEGSSPAYSTSHVRTFISAGCVSHWVPSRRRIQPPMPDMILEMASAPTFLTLNVIVENAVYN